jgi:hypothetical protein
MESAVVASRLPSKKALENYASAYVGAYMSAVEKERPEHLPALARSHPHEIEVCILPNQCFVMLFERAEKQDITVAEHDWSYVESTVMSGISHIVVVYAHEGPTVADAISKGKRDAIRDVRAIEDSALAKAVSQLDKILNELAAMEKGNKGLLRAAEMFAAKLEPIRDAVRKSGPEVDMLAMIDAVKNYPTTPVAVNIDLKEKEILEKIVADLGDMSDVIRRVEAQDQRLEQLDENISKALSEFQRTTDEKFGKGLAMVLASADRKIDKGLATVQDTAKNGKAGASQPDIEKRLKTLEDAVKKLKDQTGVAKEVVLVTAQMRENLDRIGTRMTKIERFLVELSKAKSSQRK